jgi:ribosomal protein L37AE/L43A
LSLEEIEALHKAVKRCPKCDSTEGFWLTAKRDKSYVQCKHCGAILELFELFPGTEKMKTFRGILKK